MLPVFEKTATPLDFGKINYASIYSLVANDSAYRQPVVVADNTKQPAKPASFGKIPGVQWIAGQIDNARVYEIPEILRAKSVSLPMFPFVDVKADLASTTGAVRERTLRLEVDSKTWRKLFLLPLVARRARYLSEDAVTADKWGKVLSMSRDFFKAGDDYDKPVSAQGLIITMQDAGEYIRGNQLSGGVDGLKARIAISPVLDISRHGYDQRMKWADQILPNGMARELFTTDEEQESVIRTARQRAALRGPSF